MPAAVWGQLALLACLIGIARGKGQARPIVSFTFTEDQCNSGFVVNDENRGFPASRNSTLLIRSGDSVRCSPSIGVASDNVVQGATSSSSVASQSSLRDLLELLSDDKGISFEMFFKPIEIPTGTPYDPDSDSSKFLRPIMTLGRDTTLPNKVAVESDESTDCAANQVLFQLAQRSGHLEFMFRTSDNVFEACERSSQSVDIMPGQLVHVVVTLRNNQQNVYVNSRLEASLRRPLHFHDWVNQGDAYLSLFSYPMQEATSTWHGTIHRVALFGECLSDSGVADLLRMGLPPTSPFPVNGTVTINEDAEVVPSSHPPQWYLKQAPVEEADRIALRYSWIDEDVHNLQKLTFNASPTELRPIYTYVTNPPAVGCLYQVDGTRLGCGSNSTNQSVLLPVVGNATRSEVVYLPPHNKYSISANSSTSSRSVFATIDYCVTDKVLISSSQCTRQGTQAVIVMPVNDPPVTIGAGTFDVMESSEAEASPKMLLSGYDVDNGDSVQKVQVTIPPSKGSLRLSVSRFRSDQLLHGTTFEEIGNVVNTSSSDPVYALYLWNASSSSSHGGLPVQGTSVADSFKYRVADRFGVWSTEETVHIKIFSAIACQPPTVVSVDEDSHEESELEWIANDTSGYMRDLQFYVESVPDPGIGALLHDGAQVKSGQTLNVTIPYPYNASVYSSFLPAPNYCTDLGRGREAAIRFHVVAQDNRTGRIVSVSDPQIQNVDVVCSRDKLELILPPGPFSLSQLTLRSAADESRLAKAANNVSWSGSVDPYQVELAGVTVKTVDSSQEMVNVTVSSEFGYVSFNRKHWRQINAATRGRGRLNGGSTSFWANPVDLNEIFENLTFHTFNAGSDVLTIHLEYGNCSGVGGSVEAHIGSASTPCQILSGSIPLVAQPDPHGGPRTRLLSGLHWQLLQLLVSMICFPALFLVVSRVEDAWRDRGDTDNDAMWDGDDDETVFDASDPVWIQYRCPDTGDYYYQNREDGSVTWMAPLNDSYVPWKDSVDFCSSGGNDDNSIDDDVLLRGDVL